jgi:putative nucleotidyltransferase with HDIG domain
MSLPSKVRIAILLTVGAAAGFTAALAVWLPPPIDRPWLIALGTLIGLAVFASMLDLRITEGGTTTSMDFLPQLGSLLLLGPVGAIGLSTVTMLFKQFVLQRKPSHKAAFNTAQTVLALGAAGLAYKWFGGQFSLDVLPFNRSFPAFMLAAAVFFVINSAAVSYVVSVQQKESFLRTWRDLTGGIIVFDLAISPLAYLVHVLYAMWGPVALLLSVIPLIGLRYSYGVNLQLKQLNRDLLRVLVKTIEARDQYTSGHSIRVAERARRMAEELKLGPRLTQLIETGALLHDIGKIDMAYGEILRQAGPLTPEQRELIRAHPDKGVDIVQSVRSISSEILECIRHHHEWYDGSGYPTGIAGENIPIGARIIMVADSIDAMATDRPYRAALSREKIKQELVDNRGTQFDPNVADAAIRSGILDEIEMRTTDQVLERNLQGVISLSS